MKFRSALLAGSLVANAMMLGVLVFRPELATAAVRTVRARNEPRAPQADAAAVARSQDASRAGVAATRGGQLESSPWAALDSDDLRTLVARLRAAGFSRVVVRGIVNARLEDQFEARAAELTAKYENTPFWKPDPMTGSTSMAFFEVYGQLYRERSRALRDLLGADAVRGSDGDVSSRRQFGSLNSVKVEFAQRINDDYAEMATQVRAGTQGIMLPEDREKLALLERERRADLAALFTPAELEEFDLRSSPITMQLRTTMTIMDATEAEFQAIFRARQTFRDPEEPADAIVNARLRAERQQAQAEQLKRSLGEARYADYVRASLPEFQQLHRIARQEQLPAETVARAFALREIVARESMQILENASLDTEAKRGALKVLGQNTRAQILGTLGPVAGQAYAQAARWVGYVENGGAVVINADGSVSYRSLPRR